MVSVSERTVWMAAVADLPQAAWPLKAVQVVLLAGSGMVVMVVATKMVESSRRGGNEKARFFIIFPQELGFALPIGSFSRAFGWWGIWRQ
jgi:hypothetical protein